MSNTAKDALLLIGHGSPDQEAVAEYNAFAQTLANRLGIFVQPCFLEFADPPISEGLGWAVEAGVDRVIALPLFLGPAGHQKNDVPTILNWARQQWPRVAFVYGTPLGPHVAVVASLAERVREAVARARSDIPPKETAVLVVGRGSHDPDSNSDLYKVARLLWEGRPYRWVEVAFYSLTQPGVVEGIERSARLGASRAIVVPFLLFTGRIAQGIARRAREAQARYPDLEIIVGQHLGAQEGIFQVVTQRYQEAVAGGAAMTCDLCKYRHRFEGFEGEFGLVQASDHRHGLRGVNEHHHHHHHHHHHGGEVPQR